MSMTKNWYTVDEAASKYDISIQKLLLWVENGLVRCEGGDGTANLINGDDIEMELDLTASV
jgi:hypothetical protein